jgi:hypothetical protein
MCGSTRTQPFTHAGPSGVSEVLAPTQTADETVIGKLLEKDINL